MSIDWNIYINGTHAMYHTLHIPYYRLKFEIFMFFSERLVTSAPHTSMNKFIEIKLSFMLTCNPDIIWMMKTNPVEWWDPEQQFITFSTYPAIISNLRFLSEGNFSICCSCCSSPNTNC